jgi:hypothetical protein
MKKYLIILTALFLLSPLTAFAATFTTGGGVNFAGAAAGTGQQMNFDFHCNTNSQCAAFFSTLSVGQTYTITGTGNGNNDGTYTFQSWVTSGGYGNYGLITVSETFPSPGSSFATVTFYHADPPPPDPFVQEPAINMYSMIAGAQASMERTTGFNVASTVEWSGNNLFKLFIGSGLAVLLALRGWIVAMVIIGSIIYFAYRAFRFFKH